MTPAGGARPRAAAAVWVVGLCAAAVALQWAGGGSLAPPPLTDPGGWGPWLEARGPVQAAFSLVRLVALAAVWYLAVATFVGVVVRVAGSATLVRVADRVTIGPVRRLLAGSVSLGLAASGVVAVAAPALRLPIAAAAQPAAPPTVDVPPATVTMHRLGPAEVPATPPTAADSAPEVGTTASPATDTWTVRPGECFWSIAESVLADRWGRPPTDAEIVPYWRRLIDANRHELAHRDDPDLVLPGQVFAVPAP